MMIGGDREIVQRLDPIFAALAPSIGKRCALLAARSMVARQNKVTCIVDRAAASHEQSSSGDLETTLSRAEQVFVPATSLASDQAFTEWQHLPAAVQIAESELRNAAAKRIEDATTHDFAKDLDDANLSIAVSRWNETKVRLAVGSRHALVSQIAAEVQHLG